MTTNSSSRAILFSIMTVALALTLSCLTIAVFTRSIWRPNPVDNFPPGWDPERTIHSQTALDSIASASDITAYEIALKPKGGFGEPINDYVELANSYELEDEWKGDIKTELRKIGTWPISSRHSCIPRYDLKLVLACEPATLSVYFSSSEYSLIVYEEDNFVGMSHKPGNFGTLAHKLLIKLRRQSEEVTSKVNK